jgi:hypothetical protein
MLFISIYRQEKEISKTKEEERELNSLEVEGSFSLSFTLCVHIRGKVKHDITIL